MNMQRISLVLTLTVAMAFGTALQGCGGEELTQEDNQGKAEMKDDCDGQLIANTCYHSDANIEVSFYAISARLTEMNVVTNEPWDILEDYMWPDPVVYIDIYRPGADPEEIDPYRGRTMRYKDECTVPRWDNEPLLQIIDAMGQPVPQIVPLSYLLNPDNVLSVSDRDMLFSEPMGECAINPTEKELAEGIISPKDGVSTAMIDDEEVTRKGLQSNILELKIGITVESF